MPKDEKKSSKSLVPAIFLLFMGAMVCGQGSIVLLTLAGLLTLPALLNKQSVLGWIILILSFYGIVTIYPNNAEFSYLDYLKRQKVKEALQLLNHFKTSAEAWHHAKGYWPSPAELNTKIQNKYVETIVKSSLINSEKVVYTAIMKTSAGFEANITLGLAYLPLEQRWSCKDVDTHTTKIAQHLLPTSCRP